MQSTEGIILSTKKVNEADLRVSLVTRDYGKAAYIVKGIRKTKKRSISSLEAGSKILFTYHQPRESSLGIIQEHSLAGPLLSTTSYEKIIIRYFFLEAVDKTLGERDGNNNIYPFCDKGITTLESTENIYHFALFSLLHIIRLQGLIVPVSTCKSCGKGDFNFAYLDIEDLHPICTGCYKSSSKAFPKSLLSFMELCITNKFSVIESEPHEKEALLSLVYFLISFLEYHFNVTIKSGELLRTL